MRADALIVTEEETLVVLDRSAKGTAERVLTQAVDVRETVIGAAG
jgi:hypothetical protein